MSDVKKTWSIFLCVVLVLVGAVSGQAVAKQPVTVEIFYSGGWHVEPAMPDAASRVRVNDPITINHGAGSEQSGVVPSDASVRFDDRDGRMNPDNRLSPLFGLIGEKTPIRVKVNGDIRLSGRAASWKPRRSLGGERFDAWVDVTIAGKVREMGQGEPPKHSALHRVILADHPAHYWRLDDPPGSLAAQSSLPNGTLVMSPSGVVGWREADSPPGGTSGRSAARLNQAILSTVMAQGAPWTVEWAVQRPADGSLDGFPILSIDYLLNGAPVRVSVSLVADSAVTARDWYHFMITAEQIGPNFELRSWKNGIAKGILAGHSGAGTVGNSVTIYAGNEVGGAPNFGMGYIAVYPGLAVDAALHSNALQGFAGELAGDRFTRICAELGIASTIVGSAAETQQMGPQPEETALKILDEIARTDAGFIHDTRDVVDGLTLRTGRSLYNQ